MKAAESPGLDDEAALSTTKPTNADSTPVTSSGTPPRPPPGGSELVPGFNSMSLASHAPDTRSVSVPAPKSNPWGSFSMVTTPSGASTSGSVMSVPSLSSMSFSSTPSSSSLSATISRASFSSFGSGSHTGTPSSRNSGSGSALAAKSHSQASLLTSASFVIVEHSDSGDNACDDDGSSGATHGHPLPSPPQSDSSLDTDSVKSQSAAVPTSTSASLLHQPLSQSGSETPTAEAAPGPAGFQLGSLVAPQAHSLSSGLNDVFYSTEPAGHPRPSSVPVAGSQRFGVPLSSIPSSREALVGDRKAVGSSRSAYGGKFSQSTPQQAYLPQSMSYDAAVGRSPFSAPGFSTSAQAAPGYATTPPLAESPAPASFSTAEPAASMAPGLLSQVTAGATLRVSATEYTPRTGPPQPTTAWGRAPQAKPAPAPAPAPVPAPAAPASGETGQAAGITPKATWRNLIVNNVLDFTSAELQELLSSCGEVARCRVMTDPATGRSKGYAFVRFINGSSAQAAVERFNGYTCEVHGKSTTLQVSYSLPRSSSRRSCNVEIGGLPMGANEALLKSIADRFMFGPTLGMFMHTSRTQGACGIVRFKHRRDAHEAVDKLNNANVAIGPDIFTLTAAIITKTAGSDGPDASTEPHSDPRQARSLATQHRMVYAPPANAAPGPYYQAAPVYHQQPQMYIAQPAPHAVGMSSGPSVWGSGSGAHTGVWGSVAATGIASLRGDDPHAIDDVVGIPVEVPHHLVGNFRVATVVPNSYVPTHTDKMVSTRPRF